MSRYNIQRTDTPLEQVTDISSNTNVESEPTNNVPVSSSPKKYVKMTMFNRFIGQFDPFNFIFNMGVGISSDLLYGFPYPCLLYTSPSPRDTR